MNLQILIALLGEQLDKLPLQSRLALVTVRAILYRLVGGDDGVFSCGSDDIKVTHGPPYLKIRRRKENLQFNVASSEQWLAQIVICFIPTKLF